MKKTNIFICLFLSLIKLLGYKKLTGSAREPNYENYFANSSGCAVFLKDDEYYIYNNEVTNFERSPCYILKIVLTLAGLKY